MEHREPLTEDRLPPGREQRLLPRLAAEPGVAPRYRRVSADAAVEIDHIRRLLATMPGVEQAKGIVMLRRGVDADGAFTLLQRWSQDSNTKLVQICAAVVDAAGAPDGGATLRRLLRQRFPDDRAVAREPG